MIISSSSTPPATDSIEVDEAVAEDFFNNPDAYEIQGNLLIKK